MREGLWRTKKGGQQQILKISKNPKIGSERWAKWCATVRKRFFPGEKGKDGAQIEKMLFWGLRNSLSAGKYMYHEENLRPDSILKSRSRLLFKNGPLLAKNRAVFFLFNHHTK